MAVIIQRRRRMPWRIPPAIMGISLAAAFAGAVGATLTLQYLKKLSFWGVVLSVGTGAAVAGYGAPAIGYWFKLSDPVENLLALFLGIGAMNIVPGIVTLSEKFAADPLAFLRQLRRRSDDRGGEGSDNRGGGV